MAISSEEVNYLVYRYLLESGQCACRGLTASEHSG